jgi:hypothetical protein
MNSRTFFLKKNYFQHVNTYTSVPDSMKLSLVNQFTCRTLAVRGGHGATTSCDGRYSSEKIGTKKTLQQKGMIVGLSYDKVTAIPEVIVAC